MRAGRFFLALIFLGGLILGVAAPAQAWWYHATRRAAAKNIMAQGVNPAKFRGSSRFGPGLYLSRRAGTARAEKGAGSTVLRFQGSRELERRTLDLRRPTTQTLRAHVGGMDLRGTVKKGVIGPKLGRQLGRQAAAHGQAIQFRSAKNGGSNLVIPKGTLRQRPHLIRPVGRLE